MKKTLVISGIFLLLLVSKPTYAQNLPPILPTPGGMAEKPVDEIIVVFKKRPTATTLLNLSSQVTNIKPEEGIATSNAFVYKIEEGKVGETIDKVSQNQNVKAAFPNHRLRPLKVTNDPELINQWNLFNLKLAGQGQTAWDMTTGSAAVNVAIIDTGVDFSHPDLVNKISSLVDCSGPGDNCSELQVMTDPARRGHGTHVTGLLAAATNNAIGIAGAGFNTKVTVIKIMRIEEGDEVMELRSFMKALVWAADHGAKIINLSLGALEENLDSASIDEMNRIINYAWERGALIVAAAGNCGGNTDGNTDCAIVDENGDITGYATNSKIYPAASPNVLAVASLTKNNTLASYSEHNDETNPKIGKWISVAAPGGECSPAGDRSELLNCVLSTIPRDLIARLLPTPPPPTPPFDPYFINAGTSMASPQVAGVAALVLAVNPNLTNAQLKTLIEATAEKSVATGATNYGAVNALAAVTAASGGSIPTITQGPSPTGLPPPQVTPSPTRYPTIAPKMRNVYPSSFPTGPYCPQTFLPTGNCTLESKNKGDANCDGVVNALDFSLWLNQLDQMVPAQPVNQNANFSCVEGNISTYFVDLADYEIWRRYTSGGLVTPGPTNPPSPTSISSFGCVNTDCVTACVRVNNGRPGGMTDFTSNDVTVKWGDMVEFRAEPFDGVTVFWYPASEPQKVYRQCSSDPGAGQTCPASNTLGSEYGTGTSSIVAFKYINRQWWMKGENDPCSDTLSLNISQ